MSAGGELAGQVALVSGGSGRIGLAIIHALGQAGAEAVSLDLTAPGEKGIAWVKGDVRDDASVGAAVEEVFQRHGRLDLVIHAAGVTRDAVLWKLSVDDWDLVQAVNLRGAFLLLRHAVPALRRGKGGRIVLIGSIQRFNTGCIGR